MIDLPVNKTLPLASEELMIRAKITLCLAKSVLAVTSNRSSIIHSVGKHFGKNTTDGQQCARPSILFRSRIMRRKDEKAMVDCCSCRCFLLDAS